MGGEIAESTQEGEEVACTLVKEAVLRQILQHTLTLHTKDGDDQVLLLAEEQLETLQALLDEGELREDKPPLPRSQIPNASNQAEEHSKVGEEAAGTGLGNNDTVAAHRTANQEDPPGALGEDDARHVVHFIRHHGPGEGLRIASSVLCATIGVIETEGGRTAETFLIRTIAGEIHNIARHILYRSQLEEEGEQLQRGTKRLSAAEIIQWEHHIEDEEQEEEEATATLMEAGEEPRPEDDTRSSTPNSHRRRRLLAAHHQDFIGEDGERSDDEQCLMAIRRYTSSSSSQDEPLPANDPPNMPPGEDVALPVSEGMEAHPGKK